MIIPAAKMAIIAIIEIGSVEELTMLLMHLKFASKHLEFNVIKC